MCELPCGRHLPITDHRTGVHESPRLRAETLTLGYSPPTAVAVAASATAVAPSASAVAVAPSAD